VSIHNRFNAPDDRLLRPSVTVVCARVIDTFIFLDPRWLLLSPDDDCRTVITAREVYNTLIFTGALLRGVETRA